MADMAVSVKIAKIFPNYNVIKQSRSYLELEKLWEMIILVLVLEKKIICWTVLTSYNIYIYNQLIPSTIAVLLPPRYSRNHMQSFTCLVFLTRISQSCISVTKTRKQHSGTRNARVRLLMLKTFGDSIVALARASMDILIQYSNGLKRERDVLTTSENPPLSNEVPNESCAQYNAQ